MNLLISVIAGIARAIAILIMMVLCCLVDILMITVITIVWGVGIIEATIMFTLILLAVWIILLALIG